MAYPVDPGRTVTWAKHPDWEQELVRVIAALPRADQIRVFAPATRKSVEWKRQKHALLQLITANLFNAHGDADKQAKQVASVQRRLTQCVPFSRSLGGCESSRGRTEESSAGLAARVPPEPCRRRSTARTSCGVDISTLRESLAHSAFFCAQDRQGVHWTHP